MFTDRQTATGILTILAFPVPVIAAVYLLALGDPNRWLGLTGAGVGIAALVVISVAAGIRPVRGPKLDIPRGERFATMLAVGFALGASCTALLLAVASPFFAIALLVAAGTWTLFWLPRNRRLVVAETTVDIDRDLHSVFAYVSDFANLVEWFPGYVAVEKLTPGPIGVGTRFLERIQSPIGTMEGNDDFIRFEPDRLVASQAPGRPNVATETFEAIGSGTRLTHRYEGIVAYGQALMGAARDRSATAKAILAADRPAFARLKQVLEGATQATS